MISKFAQLLTSLTLILLITGCPCVNNCDLISSEPGCVSVINRPLASFKQGGPCYDRQKEPYTVIVDSHVHFRPFGGPAVPMLELNEYFNKTSVRFVNIYGIGQVLPVDSDCTYYGNCPGEAVTPSIKNDFVNAANYLEFKPQGVNMVLSMTFPDLSNPGNIVDMIHLYDKEYPKMFKWVGEVNLVKQALFKNHHEPVKENEIDQWGDFMALLKDRNIPMTIHSDLGNDEKQTEFLKLFEYVMQQYPENKIVWAHMGLSKELTTMAPAKHIGIMKRLLDKYPNLTLDISWRVLEDAYFSNPSYRKLFVAFIDEYSDRFIAGTDFVASRDKYFGVYRDELEVNSRIFKYVNDEAFRNIALGENYFRLLGLNYMAPQVCN